jgi:hypothetical protein
VSSSSEGRLSGDGHGVTISPVVGAREHTGSKRQDAPSGSCHD